MSTWCKICGVRDPDTALAVAAAGADAIGLNFCAQSSRAVEAGQAALITAALATHAPHVQRVGIFADADTAQVEGLIAACDLSLLQFHGREAPAFCERFDKPYVKVVSLPAMGSVAGQHETATEAAAAHQAAWGLLLDTVVDGQHGGTGRRFDLAAWPAELAEQGTRLILAGGLTPDNVAGAVAAVQPFGVDVASGVEAAGAAKGVKDMSKVQKFIEEAKRDR